MLVLLPPSESKAAPASGAPVDLGALSHPELADARHRVADALAKVSGQRNAMQVLGTGASLAHEVARNTTVWSNPTDIAARVYSGVLFEAAGAREWDAAALERAAARVRIVSALWGVVSPADPVPAYRLSMATSLGRIGPLGAFWRRHLAASLDKFANGALVVDCRSSSYVAAWRPTETPWVTVKVMQDFGGRRAVITHMAKHTRGLLAAHLVAADAVPASAHDLADAAAELVGVSLVDVGLTANPKGPDELTLVVRPSAPGS